MMKLLDGFGVLLLLNVKDNAVITTKFTVGPIIIAMIPLISVVKQKLHIVNIQIPAQSPKNVANMITKSTIFTAQSLINVRMNVNAVLMGK